ncbi:MAG: metallophosphoesterase [Gammaproteobacteria bacterium]|nr:metallophosphoesterase [Gammaproteobacteria bacterium]
MPNQSLRFIHTSDVHLDSTSSRGDVEGFRNPAEYAFAQVVDAVTQANCELFLIVGDLFDSARIKEHDFEFVRTQLSKIDCPVVLIPGNHDVHDDTSVWRKFDPTELGSHVYPIMEHEGDLIEFPDLGATLWGRAMDEHSPNYEPLLGVPRIDRDNWYIGMAHGQVVHKRVNGSSSQITHDEIQNSGFDYLALGHVHVWDTFEFGDVTACYSGSPVEAFASSHGGYYALVDLNPRFGVSITKNKLSSKTEHPRVTHGVFF